MMMNGLSGQTPFSYACSGCGGCCRGTCIQLNPYEVARLARRKDESIANFRDRWTDDGIALKQAADKACVFLGLGGCAVYSDRPLVCRLYPLGRHIDETGQVRYSRAGGDPGPGGTFGDAGTIADFLTKQGADPFVAAADAYFAWYCRATHDDAVITDDAEAYDDLLNIDAVVTAWCGRTGQEAPGDLEGRMALHLRILNDLLAQRPIGSMT